LFCRSTPWNASDFEDRRIVRWSKYSFQLHWVSRISWWWPRVPDQTSKRDKLPGFYIL
jgi:hypothetical protein